MKLKYGDNVKVCYMDTDSFIMHIRTEDFYKDIADDVEKRFDTSNYDVTRPLHSSQHTFPPTKNGIKNQLLPFLFPQRKKKKNFPLFSSLAPPRF